MNASLAVMAAFVAAGGLAWLEGRRADRRHLAARIGATALAVGALAALGWRPAWRREAPGRAGGGVEAEFWTPGAPGDTAGANGKADTRRRFALPGARSSPADATVVPDAATVRRRFPEIGTLHVYGDGLEAFDLETWRGVRVVFHPVPTRWPDPGFSFVRVPRELPLGEPLVLQGRVRLVPGASTTVTLEAPDGTTTETKTAPADADGGAVFSLGSPPPPALGRFVWRLRMGNVEETLGVAVVPPELPRVLELLDAPRFDTAALRRWFQGAGGTLTARTRVGGGQFRFESAHDLPPQFAALDAPLLGGFDLVLADGRTLAGLPPPERDALRAAVADTGLGLLVLADDAALPGAPGVAPGAAAAFLPWKLSPLADAAGEGDRLACVGWPGQARPVEIPVPSAPFEIVPQEGQTTLVQDGQGHALAAAFARGRGQTALTLVRETGRWTRENDPGAFASYWSALFSTLARKTTATGAGRWALVNGDAGPVFADQPVELTWSGQTPPGVVPGPGTAMAEADPAGTDGALLPLAPDPANGEPGRWRTTFWPRRSGWQRVAMPGTATGGGTLDFFVAPTGNWPALAAARRRAATARCAEDFDGTPPPIPAAGKETVPVPIPPGWWFAAFLLGAGYLWAERRQAG